MTLARVRLSQSKSRTKNNKENKDGELCMEKIQRDLSKKKVCDNNLTFNFCIYASFKKAKS